MDTPVIVRDITMRVNRHSNLPGLIISPLMTTLVNHPVCTLSWGVCARVLASRACDIFDTSSLSEAILCDVECEYHKMSACNFSLYLQDVIIELLDITGSRSLQAPRKGHRRTLPPCTTTFLLSI